MVGDTDEATFAALHELSDTAPPALKGREQVIEVPGLPEGETRMTAYLSLPANARAPLPGVLVIHEWWGLNDHIRHWADRLAAEGYAALAVDLYEGKVATNSDEAMAAMRAVDADEARERLLAARRWLEEEWGGGDAPTAAIGWCFGGAWSLRLAVADPQLDAAVIFYGRANYEPEDLAAIEARLLGIFGNLDQNPDPEWVNTLDRALDAADVSHRFLRYDANHAFANPSGTRYDQGAAADAWHEVRAFLSETLR